VPRRNSKAGRRPPGPSTVPSHWPSTVRPSRQDSADKTRAGRRTVASHSPWPTRSSLPAPQPEVTLPVGTSNETQVRRRARRATHPCAPAPRLAGSVKIPVSPNSMAARKWGKTSWTTHLERGRSTSTAAPGDAGVEYTTRDAARAVTCPRCGAAPGIFCQRQRRTPEDRERCCGARHAQAIAGGARVIYRAGKPLARRRREAHKR
jgi:hypothetical protein